MRRPLRWTGLLLLAALAAGRAPGQDITFEASLDKTSVGVGENLTLSLVLKNVQGGGEKLRLPEMNDFRITAGPMQSSSFQMINGVVSSSVTYSYTLQAKATGTFTLGPATIEVRGTEYHTQPVTVQVVQGHPQSAQAEPAEEDVSAQIGENLFLKATVDKARVRQGEQINLTFRLYTRVSVLNYAVKKDPAMTGFWSEDVETPRDISLSTEVVNGKQYRVGVIRRMALFPTQSGKLEIAPMELQATVQVQPRRSNDPFESFFRDPFGRNVSATVRSEPITLTVAPLPGGAPATFRGAVGEFAMSAGLDKRTTRTNEAVTLKITISGTGNIKLLESPSVEVPPDFEQYTPKVSESISRNAGSISGSKTFEYLFIPRFPGLKTIKPVSFVYFDLKRNEYVTLRSPQLEVNVEPGAVSAVTLPGGGARADVRALTEDIRFIKVTGGGFSRKGELPHTGAGFITLLVLPLLGLGAVVVYARRREAELADGTGLRTRRAIKVAQRGLKQAEYLLREKSGSSGEPSSIQRARFYTEVSRALWSYLGDRLGIEQAELTVERAAAELKSRSVDGGLVHALRVLLESCDMARFAPTALELSSMQRAYDEARRIIIELERSLKS
jgi:hypothetical protein